MRWDKYKWPLAVAALVAAGVWLWPRRLVWVRAGANGKEYRVKPLPDAADAANRLAELELRLRSFLDAADRVRPGDARLRNIRDRWNGTLAETPGGKDIAYSIGKDSVYVCIRDQAGRLDDVNTCMFVLLHELAHLATDAWGHPAQFWKNMKFLLELAERVGSYAYQDFDAQVVTYCGSVLGGSPLACVKAGTCESELAKGGVAA